MWLQTTGYSPLLCLYFTFSPVSLVARLSLIVLVLATPLHDQQHWASEVVTIKVSQEEDLWRLNNITTTPGFGLERGGYLNHVEDQDYKKRVSHVGFSPSPLASRATTLLHNGAGITTALSQTI